MDDLISRAALLKSLNEQAPKPTTDDLYTVNMCIINAPAIDAIPVEWLMKVLAEANEFPISERETIVAIPYLVKRWQKEQEAR